ncbi:endonuclease/exonuclease/phosphatase family protein [Streptomyces sp. NPDC050610]|uniref:endonuclease/exonuclease/phosphatase family protein n=1 Tax=Streptomyces sp. NPDC050610 TaxID=3157097 RepID=UPI003419EC57
MGSASVAEEVACAFIEVGGASQAAGAEAGQVAAHVADGLAGSSRLDVAQYGTRLMHTRPDEVLRTAGMEDVARHWATTPGGHLSALARTVDGCDAHGPDARIDRMYASGGLLPAVRGVDVVEVPHDLSDHHLVRLTLDPDTLSGILNQQPDNTPVHTPSEGVTAWLHSE